jgi:hypothetical protein
MSQRPHSRSTAPEASRCEAEASPVYWFFLLEDAKQRFDFVAAAHARQQLERLGVRVIYLPRRGGPRRAS